MWKLIFEEISYVCRSRGNKGRDWIPAFSGMAVRRIFCLFYFLIFLFSSNPSTFSDELKIISPWPSPYGIFKEILLVPHSEPIPNTYQPGSLAVTSSGRLVFISTDQDGDPAPVDATVWEQENHAVYPLNTDSDPDLNWGVGTKTPPLRLSVNEGLFLITGPLQDPSITLPLCAQGEGTRLLIYPNLGALRAGYVSGDQWDESNLGLNSTAFGDSNIVGNPNSFATGSDNEILLNPTNLDLTSAIIGGAGNVNQGTNSTIAGGIFNIIFPSQNNNIASSESSVISGDNNAVLSGINNAIIAANNAAILGGQWNVVRNEGGLMAASSATQGNPNAVNGQYGSILSATASGVGVENDGDYSSIIASTSILPAINDVTKIHGGSSYSLVAGALGGDLLGTYNALMGGNKNFVGGNRNVAVGGSTNLVDGQDNVVAGGSENQISTASNVRSFIGGGFSNAINSDIPGQEFANNAIIEGRFSVITNSSDSVILNNNNSRINDSNNSILINGANNQISQDCDRCTILNGTNNSITESINALIASGTNNEILAGSEDSLILGGDNVSIEGDSSFAFGRNLTIQGDRIFAMGFPGVETIIDQADSFVLPGMQMGIGIATPSATLQVAGNIIAQPSAGISLGNNRILYRSNPASPGYFEFLYQNDIAELYPTIEEVEPGDVLVSAPDTHLKFKKSDKPFDKTVIGIVSSNPAVVFEDSAIQSAPEEGFQKGNKPPVALAGRVLCKVSLENGPIEMGDFLTTSSTPGHAMKASDEKQSTGAIIGKALESFKGSGDGTTTGAIAILVTLQ